MLDPLDSARRNARDFSGRLGTLAGSLSGRVPGAMNQPAPAQIPPRLAAALEHFRRRHERTEEAARTLRANALARD